MDGHLCYLSEVEYVVVGVGHLLDKEFTVEQPDLVELVLVDGVVYDGVGGGVLRGDKAVGGNHGDVPPPSPCSEDGGGGLTGARRPS